MTQEKSPLCFNDPYAWPCPVCRMPIGKGCVDPRTGHWQTVPHHARKECATAKNAHGVARGIKEHLQDAEMGLGVFYTLSVLGLLLVAGGFYLALKGHTWAQVGVCALCAKLLWDRHRLKHAEVEKWYDEQVQAAILRVASHMPLSKTDLDAYMEVHNEEFPREP